MKFLYFCIVLPNQSLHSGLCFLGLFVCGASSHESAGPNKVNLIQLAVPHYMIILFYFILKWICVCGRHPITKLTVSGQSKRDTESCHIFFCLKLLIFDGAKWVQMWTIFLEKLCMVDGRVFWVINWQSSKFLFVLVNISLFLHSIDKIWRGNIKYQIGNCIYFLKT